MSELISIDGTLTPAVSLLGVLPLDELLAANFVWQKVTVFGRRVVGAEWAVEVAQRAYRALYGGATGFSAAMLEREVKTLLDAMGLPERGGAVVALYLFPNGMRALSCERQLAWREFSHQTGLTAAPVRYDAGFGDMPTAAALTAHTAALAQARRAGADIALREMVINMLDAAIAVPCYSSVGEWPLFAVTGGSPEQRGRIVAPHACDSVQRRLGLAACRAAGLIVEERPLPTAEIATLEELFAVTPAGLASICEFAAEGIASELSGIPALSHSLAARIAKHL